MMERSSTQCICRIVANSGIIVLTLIIIKHNYVHIIINAMKDSIISTYIRRFVSYQSSWKYNSS